jgi:hypothetical protein
MKRVAPRPRRPAVDQENKEALALLAGADPAELAAAKLLQRDGLLSFMRWEQLGPASQASYVEQVRRAKPQAAKD